MNIYCGNNRRHTSIVSEQARLGTRYECMRKGIGVGLHRPLDNDYTGEYEAVDKRKIYCGNDSRKPAGYNLMGSPSMCLRKGIGIGKKKRHEYGDDGYSPEIYEPNIYIWIVIYLILFLIFNVFLVLYTRKLRKQEVKQI